MKQEWIGIPPEWIEATSQSILADWYRYRTPEDYISDMEGDYWTDLPDDHPDKGGNYWYEHVVPIPEIPPQCDWECLQRIGIVTVHRK